MATQWQVNPANRNNSPSPTNMNLGNGRSSALITEDFHDSESIQPSILSEVRTDKDVSHLPPFDIPTRKITSKSTPFTVSLQTKRDVFLTNDAVQGQIDISCSKGGVAKLGKIAVYLVGFEETIKGKTRVFLSKKWVIQDPLFAPCDAVLAGQIDEHGMWLAKQGTTTFNFSIPFETSTDDPVHIVTSAVSPDPLPSSYWHSKAGGIRYVLAGYLVFAYLRVVENRNGTSTRLPIAYYKEIFVLEGAEFGLDDTFSNFTAKTATFVREHSEVVTSGFLGFGKKGKASLKASLRTLRVKNSNIEPGIWLSGQPGFLGIDIQNESAKKISLVRILKLFKVDKATGGYLPMSYSKIIVSSQEYNSPSSSAIQTGKEILDAGLTMNRGWCEDADKTSTTKVWDGVIPGKTRQAVMSIDVPANARSIRHASMIDVGFEVEVTVTTANRKTVQVQIPITVLSPISILPDLPRLDLEAPPAEILSNTAGITVDYVDSDSVRGETPVPELPVKHEESTSTLLEAPPPVADSRSSTISRKLQPLKTFARASTTRRPLIKAQSPASAKLRALDLSLPPPPTSAPPTVIERQGAKVTTRTTNLDDYKITDLDQELDKLFDGLHA